MKKINNFFKTSRDRGLIDAINATLQELKGVIFKAIGKRFIKRKIYNYEMLLDLNDNGISRALWLFGNRELEHKFMLEKVIKPGMSILDIGANIGYYPLMELKLIGNNGNLIAVEPSNTNISLLKQNLSLNNFRNIEIHQGAISDTNSKKEIFISTQSNLNTFHNYGTGIDHLSGEKLEVKTFTISKILNGRKADLIRMDVEGHEVEILNGLVSNFKDMKKLPIIIFETHISRYSKSHDFSKTLQDIFHLGYEVVQVGSSSERGSEIIKSFGYHPIKSIKSDGVVRMIFEDINRKDAIKLICETGGIRTVLLKPKEINE